MIEFYLDTVDTEQVSRFNECIPVKGVTTNPSILAKAGIGVNQALAELAPILGGDARFHVQVVSQTIEGMVKEAEQIDALPYDMVVKIPATEVGLAAIKKIKRSEIVVLATAIYSSQQGFLAAICGADYLAPYVNRMDTIGANGIGVVADLQQLVTQQELNCKILPASFKNTLQVMEVLKLGVQSITLPVDVISQMISNPATLHDVEQFSKDWNRVFGTQLSSNS